MSKNLVLVLTDHFPCDMGEEYFAMELPYLADLDAEILLIPVRRSSNDQIVRDLPRGVRVVLPAAKPGINKWRNLLLKLPRILASKEGFIDWHNIFRPRQVLSDFVFAAESLEKYDRISKALAGIDLSEFSSVIIYSYWLYYGVAVGRQLELNEFNSVPVTLMARAHRYDLDEGSNPSGYLAARPYFSRILDQVCVISETATQHLPPERFPHQEKILVRRLGVPPQPVVDRDSPKNWVVSCSSTSPVKRLPLLMDAVAEVDRRGTPIRWTHIGGEDTELLDELAIRGAQLSDRSSVELLGRKPGDFVRTYHLNPDICAFINVSDTEGVPVSIMEALACSLPAIATDTGGTYEIVHDGENGTLLPLHPSADEIADAIEKHFEMSADTKSELAKNARRVWADMANSERLYSDFAQELEQRLESQQK